MKPSAHKPPKLATWFLFRFLRRDLAEDVSGDLEEHFQIVMEERSKLRAKLDYWYQVLAYLRPFAIRKMNARNHNHMSMYRSYFKTSLRNIRKDKLHSVINISGLSTGIAVTILIGLWIYDELSYEKHFDRYEKIGQVLQHVTNNGEVDTWISMPWPLAAELRENYGSNFDYVVMSTGIWDNVITYEDKHLSKTGVFAEPKFCELFTLNMKRGSWHSLDDPSGMIISESLSKTYFGDDDPIGKQMLVNEMPVHVTGVYEDVPEQSQLKDVHYVATWEMLYNNSPWIRNMEDPWRPNVFRIYVGIADHHTFAGVSSNIRDAKLKNLNAELAKKKPELFVHPMTDWRLYARFTDGQQDGGFITYVRLFAVIALFVILMACINFMNLSTARAEQRAKEVGIRKAIGSYRTQLIQQFFAESFTMAMMSFVLALLIVYVSLPAFNLLADKQVSLPLEDPRFWFAGMGLCFMIGILSGMYPALYFSSITPQKALKGAFRSSQTSAFARKGMVVVQFVISLLMIVSTLVVFQQIEFAKNREIGYHTEGLVAVPASSAVSRKFAVIKEALLNAGVITAMASADAPTTVSWSSTSGLVWPGKDPALSVDFANVEVSHDYGRTINWEIAEGRDFSVEVVSDSSAFVINEAAAKYMQLEHPIGEKVQWYGREFEIIGVARDVVVDSPFEPVRPTIYALGGDDVNYMLFRIAPDRPMPEALSHIETLYKKFESERPFSFEFMDESYARKFGNEERIGKLGGVFTTLAILISCLGIFGLSSFMASRRTKEIGIRKVHGASVFQVWKLISKDFVILVLISTAIALPLAFYLASGWLQRYTYRIPVSWTTLLVAAVGIFAITLLTVSWHTLLAARTNPAKSLRVE